MIHVYFVRYLHVTLCRNLIFDIDFITFCREDQLFSQHHLLLFLSGCWRAKSPGSLKSSVMISGLVDVTGKCMSMITVSLIFYEQINFIVVYYIDRSSDLRVSVKVPYLQLLYVCRMILRCAHRLMSWLNEFKSIIFLC